MRMFADDTKIWNIIKSDSDCSDLQMDIDVLAQWSNRWLLHFNTDKCKVMSLGHSVHHDYCMTDLSNLKSLDSSSSIFKDMFDRSFVSGMPIAGAQISFPESGRGLCHVTPTFLAGRSAIPPTAWLLVNILKQFGTAAPFWSHWHQKVAKIWVFAPHIFQRASKRT